jgi:hypothetical protein
MDNHTEKAYSPKEISLTLDIGDSSLRKWCLALEKEGYQFIRNDKKNRIFVESDLVVLRHFQQLVKQHNMQLENAAKLVVDRFGNGAFEVSTGIVPAETERDLSRSQDEMMETLLQHIRTQEEFNRQLLHRLDEQQSYIQERLEQRDKQLMESIRESQEVKQQLLQIATAQEEEKKKRKGFFRFFSKD